MKRVLMLLVVWAGHMTEVTAQEPPHLEFLRVLRERGHHDLALEYLRKLEQRPNLPPDLKAVLPLELAKSEAEAATRATDPAERSRLVAKAKAGFLEFIKANAKHPSVGDAHLAIARMSSAIGQAQAAEASLAGDEKEKATLLKAAVAAFEDANKSFVEANKNLEERFRAFNATDPKVRAERQAAFINYLQSLFDHGQMLFEKNEAHFTLNEQLKSGEALKAATKALDTLAGFRNEHALGWIGYAWFARCSELIDEQKSQQAYRLIMAERKPEAFAAQRAVGYFRIISESRKGAARQTFRPMLEKWLNDYPGFLNSREGQHVRFLLALQYLGELEDVKAKTPAQMKAAANQQLVDRAVAHLNAIESGGGEYATSARNAKYRALRLSGRAANLAVSELRTFEECLLRGSMEAEDIGAAFQKKQKAPKSEQEEAQKEMDAHAVVLLDVMRRAITLMPENVKDDDWERAYRLMYSGYRLTGDFQRQAILMDYMARHAKKPDDAKTFAIQALQDYLTVANQVKDRTAMRHALPVAAMIEQKWPAEPAADVSREILADQFWRDKNLRKAAEKYEQITAKSSAFSAASRQAGRFYWVLHIQATKDGKKPVQTPGPDLDRAIGLYKRSLTALDAAKDKADPLLNINARLELADIYNTLGKTDDVLALLPPLVDKVEKKALPASIDPNVEARILGLAMRTHVLKKDIPKAMKILETLQKQGGNDNESFSNSMTDMLRQLGGQIRAQIIDLEQQGPGAQAQLAQTRDSFRQFLDHLTKDPKLPDDLRLWAGSGFTSLGDHLKAYQLYSTIPDPGVEAGKTDAKFQQSVLLRVISLRMAGQAERDANQKKQLLARAETELTAAMKRDPFRRHPKFHQEKIILLQEQGLYSGPAGAIASWDKLIQALEKNLENKTAKEVYYEAQLNRILSMYGESQLIKDKNKRMEALRRAAQSISALERSEFGGPEYKTRIMQFLDQPEHRDLKQELEKLKKESAAAG